MGGRRKRSASAIDAFGCERDKTLVDRWKRGTVGSATLSLLFVFCVGF